MFARWQMPAAMCPTAAGAFAVPPRVAASRKLLWCAGRSTRPVISSISRFRSPYSFQPMVWPMTSIPFVP